MARTSRRMQALTLLLLLAPLAAHAQLTSVPNLSSTGTTQAQTTGKTTGGNSATSNSQSPVKLTNAPTLNAGASSSDGGLRTALTGTYTQSNFGQITGDAPTLAGVGIPSLVIPYTAGAPFMRKSGLPEGTFFIAVGAVLAFLGACVLLWRGMVAWSINRSVKRTALASMQLNEKQPRSGLNWRSTSGNSGYNRVSTAGRGSFYKDAGAMSAVSLDNLTATGKQKPHLNTAVSERHVSGGNAPPANLFFSPTAHATQNRDSMRRSSGYMPSGYYASPAAAQAAGGMPSTTIGGLAPGHGNSNRYSATSNQSGYSPPSSPGLPPQSRGSTIAPPRSRDGLRGPPSRDGLGSNRNSAYMHGQPSTSSLMVGSNSVSDLASSRAPSAYLEELFDNHGNGPRERFQ